MELFLAISTFIFTNLLPTSAQLISYGPCPNVPGMRDLNVTKYAGRWYDMEKYWYVVQATLSCTTIDYLPNFDIQVQMIEGITKLNLKTRGQTRFSHNNTIADLLLDFDLTQGNTPLRISFPYSVLATDYNSYTIKYSCLQLGPIKAEGMWILSRLKNYSEETQRTVRQILHAYGLKDQLIKSDRALGKRCPW